MGSPDMAKKFAFPIESGCWSGCVGSDLVGRPGGGTIQFGPTLLELCTGTEFGHTTIFL